MRKNAVGVVAVLALVAAASGQARATTVCDVQAYDPATGLSPMNGATVTVTGLATVPIGIFQPLRTSIYIRGLGVDGCGINVFSSTRVEEIGLGDTVTVTGQVQEYISTAGNGATTEITFTSASAVTVRRGTTIPEPVVMATGQVGRESNEGKFVRVTGKLVTGQLGRSFSIDDGTGELEIFDLGQSFSADSTWRVLRYGDEVTVTGVVSQSDPDLPYLSDYSLIPRSPRLGDVGPPYCSPGCIPDTTKAPFYIKGRVFCPTLGEKATIVYEGPNTVRVMFRVFDGYGRNVATFDDPVSLCGGHLGCTITWDGRNELREELPVGLYRMEITIIDNKTRAKIQKVEPVVIGRRLR